MKAYDFFPLCASVLAAALLTGCPPPIGGCRYGKIPEEKGRVTITSIEKIHEGKKELIKVTVKGFFQRHFTLSPHEYDRCMASKGYKVGSEMTGKVLPGGPCPPMYYLEDCVRD